MTQTRYNMSVNQLLEKASSLNPNKEVIVDERNRMTYRELDTEASYLASGLSKLGIEKGDRVAVSLPNWHETIVIYFALAKIGAVLIPFNTRFRKGEVEYILRNSGAKAIFFSENVDNVDHYQQYMELSNELQTLEYLITVRFKADRAVSYTNLVETGKSITFNVNKIDVEEDIYAILYTSGTTGNPKGAMLTHKNVVHTAVAAGEWMRCTPEDVFLMPTPIFHVMGINFIFRAVASEGKIVLMEKYKPEKALSLIEKEKVTVHPGVPTMFILELNHPKFLSYDLSSLRTGEMAAAACPVEIVQRVRTEMNCNVLVAYGMTETSPVLTVTSFDDSERIRSETVGKPLPGVEIKIVNEEREELEVGEIGELACKSFGLMKGYFNMPEKTAEAVDENGWYYSGDLATIDEDGYVRIVGRKKEMIIRGGYNIYPREIEEHFYSHSDVSEVAIVGLSDSVLGEISCACIRLRAGRDVSEEEMMNFIKNKIADYKIPDKIVFVEEFPMTPSGKIKKVLLKEQLAKRITTR
ncbi:long-chain-fatty-acid--CoA ligase [Alkalihalobacillus deserti]|uniref:long-chain-fatty-acid--CoA ligase n=1 Tax=Alkalihalobacillus deserti TaxID=2879466 RepID=UPI001D143AB8|nr:long-chain-fatty-acid--CoA ligase [Alkalihalobacillus deserti]